MINSVYVASSWRNNIQPVLINTLKTASIDVYDFRNPPNRSGFHWSQVMLNFNDNNQTCNEIDYLKCLDHPISIAGFESDFDAMKNCDACVLVLPCGRSAHLELGWFVGQGKPTAILLDGPQVTPELMYKMVDYIALTIADLLEWLGVQ